LRKPQPEPNPSLKGRGSTRSHRQVRHPRGRPRQPTDTHLHLRLLQTRRELLRAEDKQGGDKDSGQQALPTHSANPFTKEEEVEEEIKVGLNNK